jgi:prepilin-type N-terminal cleavage/methylation domain-containing protein
MKSKERPSSAQYSFRRSRNAGFTLIELLVAFSLLSIILGALYSTFFLSHKAMAGMDDFLVKLQEGRMAIDTMSREADSTLYGKEIPGSIFKLEDRDAMGKQASRFTFYAFSPLVPGLSQISYYAEEVDGKLVIFKEMQSPHRNGPQSERVEVMEDVEAFLVEAGEQDQWLKTWDASGTDRTPSEVRFTILVSAKDRKLSLSQTAKLKIGRSMLMQ